MVKDGREWCLDVLDKFVVAGQSVSVGEAVVRRYRPVSSGHNHVVLGIYSSDSPDAQVLCWARSLALGCVSLGPLVKGTLEMGLTQDQFSSPSLFIIDTLKPCYHLL